MTCLLISVNCKSYLDKSNDLNSLNLKNRQRNVYSYPKAIKNLFSNIYIDIRIH